MRDEGNGVFYLALSSGPHKGGPGVHFDELGEQITVVIYLKLGWPAHFGTSLWTHKSSDLMNAPTRQDVHRSGKPIARVRDTLERHGNDSSNWLELDGVGYRHHHRGADRRRMTNAD